MNILPAGFLGTVLEQIHREGALTDMVCGMPTMAIFFDGIAGYDLSAGCDISDFLS